MAQIVSARWTCGWMEECLSVNARERMEQWCVCVWMRWSGRREKERTPHSWNSWCLLVCVESEMLRWCMCVCVCAVMCLCWGTATLCCLFLVCGALASSADSPSLSKLTIPPLPSTPPLSSVTHFSSSSSQSLTSSFSVSPAVPH